MSTFQNITNIADWASKDFAKEFDYYLTSYFKIYNIQSSIGIEDLTIFPENTKNIYLTYLFFVESANTTSTAVIRLLSSNIFSDCYSLLRILFEIACLLHFGNCSEENKSEIYDTFFGKGLTEKEHNRNEWKLTQKATTFFLDKQPELNQLKDELNNFGSHISRAKIALGNVGLIGERQASKFFTPNFKHPLFRKALGYLYSIMLIILEEYIKHNISYNSAKQTDLIQVKLLNDELINQILPKLMNK